MEAEYFIRCTEENKKRVYTDNDGQLRYAEKMFELGCPWLKRSIVLTYDQGQEYFKWIDSQKSAPVPRRGIVQAIRRLLQFRSSKKYLSH